MHFLIVVRLVGLPCPTIKVNDPSTVMPKIDKNLVGFDDFWDLDCSVHEEKENDYHFTNIKSRYNPSLCLSACKWTVVPLGDALVLTN